MAAKAASISAISSSVIISIGIVADLPSETGMGEEVEGWVMVRRGRRRGEVTVGSSASDGEGNSSHGSSDFWAYLY